jgi:O-antigen ligase
VLGSIIGVLAFAGLTVTSRAGLRTVLGIAVAMAIALGAVSVLSSHSSSGSFDRYETISNPGEAVSTAFTYKADTWALVPTYASKYPLGAGLGSGGPASTQPGASTSHGKLNAENEAVFMLIEVGIPGLIVIVGFNLTLLYICVTRIRRIADRELRVLLTGIAAPLFALFSTWLVGVSTATTPAAPYLWLSAGILAYWLLGSGWEEARVRSRDRTAGPAETAPPLLQAQHG